MLLLQTLEPDGHINAGVLHFYCNSKPVLSSDMEGNGKTLAKERVKMHPSVRRYLKCA